VFLTLTGRVIASNPALRDAVFAFFWLKDESLEDSANLPIPISSPPPQGITMSSDLNF
jgi:hypothetical protein